MSYEIPSVSEEWRDLVEQYGPVTLAETMYTGTANTVLPRLVSARAAYQMLTKTDDRNFCRLEQVPPGTGNIYYIQRFTAAATAAVSEAATISGTDQTQGAITFTLQIFGIRTDVSDLYQRQAAINIADAIGRLHGNEMIGCVNANILAALAATTTNNENIAGTGEQVIAWANTLNAMSAVEGKAGEPDTFFTHPKKLHELMRKDVTQLFIGAYGDYLRSGKVNTIAGMAVYSDPLFNSGAWTGTQYEPYAYVLQADEAVGWAQAWDVSTEIQRLAENIGFKMVTSLAGNAQVVVPNFVTVIQHS